MSEWSWFALGLLVGGPLWILVTWWFARRIWRTARRVSARAKGKENLVELGQLAGGLAHEIKNPLSTINLNLKLLSEDLQRYADEDHQRLLRRLHSVRDETARVKGILDDPSSLQKKRDAIKLLAKPNASEDLVKMIFGGT